MVALWIGCAVFAAVCVLSLLLARTAERSAKLSLHQPLYQHTDYVRYMRDKHDLNGLGFAQQLTRHMGGLTAAGLTASSLPLVGGAVFLLGPAVAAGGPAVVGIGWPVLGFFGLLTACAIAAFASAVPTAGGCYHWAIASGDRRAGLWAGWLHIAGTAIMLATTNIYLADWMSRNIERQFGYTGGASLFYIILVMLFVTQATANIRALRTLGGVLAASSGVQLAVIAGMFGMMAAIAWPGLYPFQLMAYASPSSLSISPEGGGATSVLLGLLLLQRLFLGIGDGAQAGEETRDPRMNLPWSIYLSAAGLAILGFVLFVFIVMHARVGAFGLTGLPALGDWLVDVWRRWGDASAALFFALTAALVWANGTSTMGAGARTLFAMARDEALPMAGKMSGVSVPHRSPFRAMIAVAFIAGMIALVTVAAVSRASLPLLLPQLVLLSVAVLHAAYAIPVGGRFRQSLKARKDRRVEPANRKRSKLIGPWQLGKYGLAIDGIVLCWLAASALAAVCLLKPAALLIAAACLIAGAVGIERMQRSLRRKSPLKIVGSMRFGRRTMDECIRIERKFPQ